MITNILIAISYFGVGFFVGMFTAAAITLSAYKKKGTGTVYGKWSAVKKVKIKK